MLAFICKGVYAPLYSYNTVQSADLFCSSFVGNLSGCSYGDRACTPNMHLYLHLKQCIIDYGPVYSFWCASECGCGSTS